MRGRLVAAAVLLGVGLGLAPSSGPSSGRAEAASCPATPSAESLIAMGWVQGPLAAQFPEPVGFISEQGRACYGSRLLRFRAFVDDAGGVGGAGGYTIRPSWLFSPALLIYAVDRTGRAANASVPFTGLYVPPEFGDVQRRYRGSWVELEARFVDPRATSCRATGVAGETPSPEQTIKICQAELVLIDIRAWGQTPDTATDRPPAPGEGDAHRLVVFVGVLSAFIAALALLRPRNRRRPGR